MPLLITAAAGVTVVVLAQRHARASARADDRRASQGAGDKPAYDSLAERLRARSRTRERPLELSAERLNAPGAGVEVPPSEPEPGEAYDAVSTDALGAEWLTRATEAQPVRQPSPSSSEFGEVTTIDLLDDEPSSLPELSLDPDSKLDPPQPEDRLRGVFDIADLLQEPSQARAQAQHGPKGRRRSS